MSGDHLSVVQEGRTRVLSLILDCAILSAVEVGILEIFSCLIKNQDEVFQAPSELRSKVRET